MDVFQEQSHRLLVMAAVMVGVVTVIFLILVRLIYSQSLAAVRSKAEAIARSEFLSNMSHEIRTPLNGLVGLNHLMKANIEDKKQLAGYLEKSANTAQYLLSLVNDILDMSKLQSGHFEMSYGPLDLGRMLEDVLSMQRENIANRGIQFETRREFQAVCIVGDELRIKQVLMNVLSNAAKFTPAGGRISLTLSQELLGPCEVQTTIAVSDTGIGISARMDCGMEESFWLKPLAL